MKLKVLLHITILSLLFLYAQPGPAMEVATQNVQPTQDFAETSPILRAMGAELKRSMEKLQLEGEKKPYFISYLLVDRKEFLTKASLGSLIKSDEDHNRFLNVSVRVGDYKFDNMPAPEDLFDDDKETEEHNEEYSKVPIPLTDDLSAVRHALWLLTDLRYKWAFKQFAKKEGKRAREVEEERSDDFSKEEPVNYIGEEVKLIIDRAKWETKVKEYSSILRKYPGILESSVSFSVEAKNDYFVSSEGTRIRQGKVYYQLFMIASTKASDGMWVGSRRKFFGWDEEDMPEDDKVKTEIETLIKEALALKDAPVMEAYAGPALIESRAAGVFLHEALGHRLESHRQESKEYGETFKDKVGKRIVPEFISVYDDPTIKEYQGKPVNGYYLFDEEGVPSQRTELVRDGILKNFLCSRKPIKGFNKSNGHGRAMMLGARWGYVPVSRQGNLTLETSKPISFAQLKRLLLDECRKQNKPYGLVFVRSKGGETSVDRYSMEVFQSYPLLVYRVDAKTGEEELVRGVKFGSTPLVGLDKIMSTGDDPEVFNGFCGAESGAVPVALIAPSILLSEIEIGKKPTGKKKPPILPPPFYGINEMNGND